MQRSSSPGLTWGSPCGDLHAAHDRREALRARILAAYGGGAIVDGYRPDRWDIIGAVICLGGVSVINVRSWHVLASWESSDRFRCVDIFSRPEGSFGFEEFRRDPEDMGAWAPAAYFSGATYATQSDVERAAKRAVSWLADENR